ncbi:hypothetical protein AAVH_32045, partial [Aphelenchoides avenae]
MTSPPAAWYELLNREPDKERRSVYLGDRQIHFGRKLRIIFVTSKDPITFRKEFLRMVMPVVLGETLDLREAEAGPDELS